VQCHDAKRSEAAIAIWRTAIPAMSTLVETYLASRRLHIPAAADLRYHAGLKHPSGGIWPAMVAPRLTQPKKLRIAPQTRCLKSPGS
jgi:hypothetical protein